MKTNWRRAPEGRGHVGGHDGLRNIRRWGEKGEGFPKGAPSLVFGFESMQVGSMACGAFSGGVFNRSLVEGALVLALRRADWALFTLRRPSLTVALTGHARGGALAEDVMLVRPQRNGRRR